MKTNITNCTRCGGSHSQLDLQPLTQPLLYLGLAIATHFAPCPANQEPVLVLVRAEPPPAPPRVSCQTCPYAKALHLQVYCKLHPELLPLPESLGHVLRRPLIQEAPPRWCPLLCPAT